MHTAKAVKFLQFQVGVMVYTTSLLSLEDKNPFKVYITLFKAAINMLQSISTIIWKTHCLNHMLIRFWGPKKHLSLFF